MLGTTGPNLCEHFLKKNDLKEDLNGPLSVKGRKVFEVSSIIEKIQY